MDKIRDDLEKLRRSLAARPSGLQPTLFAGRIVSMGSIPSSTGRFVAVKPLVIGGDEVEGGAASLTESSGDPILAAWFGESAPTVGENAIVESVANRWAAYRGAAPVLNCVPTDNFCCIPKNTLDVAFSSPQLGGGMTGISWDGATTWQGSLGAVLFTLTAADGHGVLTVSYVGATHSTESQTDGTRLVVRSINCKPFQLVFDVPWIIGSSDALGGSTITIAV